MLPFATTDEQGDLSRELTDYLDGISEGKIRHKYYKDTVDHECEMGVHVDGDKPHKLLNITRPNETKEIKDYRLEIYEPVTEGLSKKIINTLNRIYNKRFFSIKFGDDEDSQVLEKYLSEQIPQYNSLLTYITDSFTKINLGDPNGCIVVVPESFDVKETDRFSPIPIYYPAHTTVDFQEGHYYTFLTGEYTVSEVTNELTFKKGSTKQILIFTDVDIQVYEPLKDGGKQKWKRTVNYTHNIGNPPIIRTGGNVAGKKPPFWYKSYISGVVPDWNRVVTLESDLDANLISHVYMERWSFSVECDNCGGSKYVSKEISTNGIVEDCKDVVCPKCKGTGHQTKSPYGEYVVRNEALRPDANNPIPPAGYIDKPVDIVTVIKESIAEKKESGYSSVNMDILNKVGENQSGIAKTIDRQGMHDFFEKYSTHVFINVIPDLIEYMTWWLFIVDGEKKVEALQPEIVPPVDFNMLTLELLMQEYKEVVGSDASRPVKRSLELEMINTRFANKEKVRKRQQAITTLQPFPGTSEDDLLSLQALGTEAWELYLSLHVEQIVDEAIAANEDFLMLPVVEQREVVESLAKNKKPDEVTVPTDDT